MSICEFFILFAIIHWMDVQYRYEVVFFMPLCCIGELSAYAILVFVCVYLVCLFDSCSVLHVSITECLKQVYRTVILCACV